MMQPSAPSLIDETNGDMHADAAAAVAIDADTMNKVRPACTKCNSAAFTAARGAHPPLTGHQCMPHADQCTLTDLSPPVEHTAMDISCPVT